MKNPILFALTVQALVAMPAYSQVARVHPELVADTTTGNRVATHMAAGGGWNTLIVLINLGTTPANYTLKFYGILALRRRFLSRIPIPKRISAPSQF